jgi:predicted glycoside hydrolase/deacetylase ChbG (UPF0249 family)
MVRDEAKLLLVNADDLGLCASVTDGIFDAHRHGIVRAASLFAIGEDAGRAARMARAEPALRVGVHLALIDGEPLSPPAEVRSLVDENGKFPSDYRQFVRRYITGRVRISQVEREWRAQLERTIGLGIAPAHLDSHQHLHLLPGLFELTLRLCRAYRVPRLRVPSGHFSTVKETLWQNLAPGRAALELLSRRAKKKLAQAPGVKMCQRFLGRDESCQLSQTSLLALIDKVQPGTQELMCHPGVFAPAALRRYGFGRNWGQELSALKSDAVRARIAERGIVLVGSLDDL